MKSANCIIIKAKLMIKNRNLIQNFDISKWIKIFIITTSG